MWPNAHLVTYFAHLDNNLPIAQIYPSSRLFCPQKLGTIIWENEINFLENQGNLKNKFLQKLRLYEHEVVIFP